MKFSSLMKLTDQKIRNFRQIHSKKANWCTAWDEMENELEKIRKKSLKKVESSTERTSIHNVQRRRSPRNLQNKIETKPNLTNEDNSAAIVSVPARRSPRLQQQIFEAKKYVEIKTEAIKVVETETNSASIVSVPTRRSPRLQHASRYIRETKNSNRIKKAASIVVETELNSSSISSVPTRRSPRLLNAKMNKTNISNRLEKTSTIEVKIENKSPSIGCVSSVPTIEMKIFDQPKFAMQLKVKKEKTSSVLSSIISTRRRNRHLIYFKI